MSTAVVLGGGVSGLSATFYLQKYAGQKLNRIILLEASDRFGGWVKSNRHSDGAVFESGPRSLRPAGRQGRNTLKLLNELNLGDEILPLCRTDAAAKNRYLFINGQLHALPNSILGLLKRQPMFSKPLVWPLLGEKFKPKSNLDDQTIHDFFSQRFNQELADVLVDSICRGIFAGDCRKLSIKSCFPDLYSDVQRYGSLVNAMILKPKQKLDDESQLDDVTRRCLDEKWTSFSFKSGMQQLTNALLERCQSNKMVDIRKSSPVKCVNFTSNGKVNIKTESEEINADLVISSIFSKDLATVISDKSLKKDLQSISAISCVVINLEYNGNLLPVNGFGHLSPSSENGPVLGIIYDSCSFPHHDRKDKKPTTRITVMLGGAWSHHLQNQSQWLPESDLLAMAIKAARDQLQISGEPIRSKVSVLNNCIPQYYTGHSKIMYNLNSYISKRNVPLYLIGSSYNGVSVNDCILNAKLAAENVLK